MNPDFVYISSENPVAIAKTAILSVAVNAKLAHFLLEVRGGPSGSRTISLKCADGLAVLSSARGFFGDTIADALARDLLAAFKRIVSGIVRNDGGSELIALTITPQNNSAQVVCAPHASFQKEYIASQVANYVSDSEDFHVDVTTFKEEMQETRKKAF